MKLFESFSNFEKTINEAAKIINLPGDNTWYYRNNNGRWEAAKQGTSNWKDISNVKGAVDKLNARVSSDTKFDKSKIRIGERGSGDTTRDMDTSRRDSVANAENLENTNKHWEETKNKYFKSGVVPTNEKLFLSPHIRFFSDFLLKKTSPATTSAFNKEEIKTILELIKVAFDPKNKSKCVKPGNMVDFYVTANIYNDQKGKSEKINFGDKKSFGVNQNNIKELATKIAMTLGNAKVTENKDSYILDDTYDFNTYSQHPEWYTAWNYPKTLLKAVGEFFTGNFIQGLEKIVSTSHKMGYPGYAVHLVIPKNYDGTKSIPSMEAGKA